MSDIFISYSRSDRSRAQTMATALEREGWSVWWDPKIPPGKTFDEVIEAALERAKCVIVLWSKKSVTSQWVKTEASEGNRRGILIPATIEDDVRIPLEFRYLHTPRLTDWGGQAGHPEFDSIRGAVLALLLDAAPAPSAQAASAAKSGRAVAAPKSTGNSDVPDGVYVDPETKLMWTVRDNSKDINWRDANQYAKDLRLGGYSDWRLPTIKELERLYEPKRRKHYNIREPFQLTDWWVWSSTREGSGSAFSFNFNLGGRHVHPLDYSYVPRALCVRGSGE